jgi:hypothetical protein
VVADDHDLRVVGWAPIIASITLVRARQGARRQPRRSRSAADHCAGAVPARRKPELALKRFRECGVVVGAGETSDLADLRSSRCEVRSCLSEAKYTLIDAASLADAVELVRSHPFLTRGGSLQVSESVSAGG